MKYEDLKTPEELYQFMKYNIKYGFVSSFNKKYLRKEVGDEVYENTLFNNYKLQSPDELLISKCGICYDQVEFERNWFITHGYKVYTYYSTYHNHVILIYKDKDTYNLFERAFPRHNSIYRTKSLNEAIDIYKEMQFKNNDVEEITLYKYDSIPYGLNFYDFIYKVKESLDTIVLRNTL